MKISALEEYGLRCLLQIARAGAGPDSADTVSTREIAEREGLTNEYAAQILATLRRAGLVTSVRGVHGGFRLAVAPEELTVGRLFRTLDGSLSDGICESYTGTQETCVHAGNCSVESVWTELARRIYGFLDQVTLADLVDGGPVRGGPQIIPVESIGRR